MPPVIDAKSCKKCGLCATVCPMDVFYFKAGSCPGVRYPEECWHCNACVLDCPANALSLRIPIPASILYYPKET